MLYKYVYDRGFVVWKVIHKTAVTFGSFLRNVQMCRSFTWNTFSREHGPSCMLIRLCGLTLYPVMDSIFSWIKENIPSLWLVFHTQILQEMLDPAFCAK